jgi:acetyltransferase-like isoleucine patch superfamily enzyme
MGPLSRTRESKALWPARLDAASVESVHPADADMTAPALSSSVVIHQESSLTRWLRQAGEEPSWPLRQAAALMRARIAFRRCQEVGRRPRLFGSCKVINYSRITIGDRLLMYGDAVRCEIGAHGGGSLEIGDGVFVNYGSAISAHRHVRIGDGSLIGQYAIIMDCDFHRPGGGPGHGDPRPIEIGRGVWVGARVTILKGVSIGDGAVIGAGSVVTSDIPARVLAAGVPARVLKRLEPDRDPVGPPGSLMSPH